MQGEAGAAGAPAPSSGKPVGRSSSLQEGCWPRAQKGRAQDKKMMSLSTDKVPGKAGKGAREAKGTGPESDHSHPPWGSQPGGVTSWTAKAIGRVYPQGPMERPKSHTFSPGGPRGPGSPFGPPRPFGPSGPSSPLGPGGPISPCKSEKRR